MSTTLSHTADTSNAALESLDVDSITERLYQFFVGRGPNGATDDEVLEQTGILHQTLGARRQQLWREGRIRETGEERITRTGRRAVVWCVVPEERWRATGMAHWRETAADKRNKGTRMLAAADVITALLDAGMLPVMTPQGYAAAPDEKKAS